MRQNLEAARGEPLTERLQAELVPRLGRQAAHALVRAALERSRFRSQQLRELWVQDADLAAQLSSAGVSAERIAELFEPSSYLGSSAVFIDRALAAHAALRLPA